MRALFTRIQHNTLVRMCDHVDRFAIIFDRHVCRIHMRAEDILLKVQLTIICSAYLTRLCYLLNDVSLLLRFWPNEHTDTRSNMHISSQFVATLSVLLRVVSVFTAVVVLLSFRGFFTHSHLYSNVWLVSQQMRRLTYKWVHSRFLLLLFKNNSLLEFYMIRVNYTWRHRYVPSWSFSIHRIFSHCDLIIDSSFGLFCFQYLFFEVRRWITWLRMYCKYGYDRA